ncbi:DUF1601 domain-containing protein [Thalassotalea sp. G20_0]|uniref:RAP domain-containing protein n=1 Tax=Thalassotalea sp. G20_0 TaxID=2821093 RepID=UPI001AD9E8C9|nr:RAP domain-containing protein [Thalassotalea sp. G20_0]MBO9496965.1 DUF1601 domain-containing protein [Thalassotalea sp. G20_0]
MDRSSAGISSQYTRSNNSYNQPNGHAPSSRHGRYRHARVRQWNNIPRTSPERNKFYHSSAACPSQYLLRRSVNPAQNFNALTKQEIMAGLVSKSDRFGHRYDGRDHGLYASTIKKYTSASKRPLNRAEQSQLMRLLQNFVATRSWNWRSLTTTLHSLTSAGVFTLHKPMDARVKLTQANLLSTLFDSIIFNCNQNTEARDFDARGIVNLLWAMAKLVDNGQEQTPEFNEALAALLPHVNAQQDQYNAQGIANLLWALAKLMDNGQERTQQLNEAVASLLHHVNAQKDQFIPQHLASLLWAITKLMDNGQEQTPEFNETVAVLLLRVNAHRANFKPQEITNLLWAIAKLVDNGQEQTPGLKEAVAALLPHVNAQKDQFNAQDIANLLWAMAKLAGNGQKQTPEFNETLAALFPHVNAQKPDFKPQGIANVLWAMAKLLDNGQERTPGLKETIAALLPLVIAQKDQFNAQGIANLLWALAKLVDNGQDRTPDLNEAVAALLPLLKAQKVQFNVQDIANLLWALAKLVDKRLERTPGLNEAVAVLLPQVNAQKANYKPQAITNLLWAMAKLVDNGLEQTPELKEAVAALLPHANAQKDQFNAQGIANLLWATAKLGELVELNVAISTFESLVYRISENLQFSQEGISMSLWGVMVCCARLALYSNTYKNNLLEKHMGDLLTRLENTSPDNEEDQSIMIMAANWLGRPCPMVCHYQTNISKTQADFRDQLKSSIPSLQIEEEKSLNSLPPVDLLLPDHNMVIEVQGPSHYVSGDFKTRNGSTLLKIALLQKAGFEVIEIPANQLLNKGLMKPYIDQIKIRIGIPPQGHGFVSHKRAWTDAAYVTVEEHLAEQTNPAKSKKTSSQ